MIGEPRVEERGEQRYVAIRVGSAMSDLSRAIPELIGEVAGWLREHDVRPAGPPFIRYLVIDMANELDVEVGFPVLDAGGGDGRVSAGTLPAGRYASVLFTGPYDRLIDANTALIQWGAREGLRWDSRPERNGEVFGARYESYLTDPAEEPDPSKWETQVLIRLSDAPPDRG